MKKVYSSNTIEAITGTALFILWIIGVAVFRWLLPQYAFGAYPFVPILFLLFAIASNGLMVSWEKKMKKGALSQRKLTTNLMIVKMVRLLICAVAIVCYVKLVAIQNTAFMVIFAIFFFVSLALETLAMYHFEKRLKSNTDGIEIKKDK